MIHANSSFIICCLVSASLSTPYSLNPAFWCLVIINRLSSHRMIPKPIARPWHQSNTHTMLSPSPAHRHFRVVVHHAYHPIRVTTRPSPSHHVIIEQVNSDKLNVVSYHLRSKLKVESWCNWVLLLRWYKIMSTPLLACDIILLLLLRCEAGCVPNAGQTMVLTWQLTACSLGYWRAFQQPWHEKIKKQRTVMPHPIQYH